MESIINWFQDWSDACVYAKECAPDFSFLPGEPFTALASIAAVCLFIWWRNEKALRASGLVASVAAEPAASYADLTDVLDHARALVSGPTKKAA
ncbi:hypothetical protein [Methylosinus sp. Sm6]|uniref:hypothetical protein n=1 Tax=Methylosinus sp. Sm6 TaxID=2866948 RepID=UPI001C996885|nr:hypothetical protein [Methylosinus sp. Sm6]MBY6242194.1 hypothetical protein [Methylosinus sp. Sm6]